MWPIIIDQERLMADVADFTSDGVVCQECGVYLEDPLAYPRSCGDYERAAAVASNDPVLT